MLSALIQASLNNRFMVLALVGLMAAAGIYTLSIPIDAVPDMTNVQVQVITKAGSLSPVEVERYVTYPVEATMNGLPNVEEIRSVSKFGLSVVTIVFLEGTDIYRSRQLVGERLADARERIVRGYGSPDLGVLTTALGEVLQFEVRGDGYSPMELRTLLEWEIAPQLRQVRGVTEVNSQGGFYKTFEITVDPNRLATQGLSLNELFAAIERNNSSAGGGYIAHHGEQRFIRGQALLKSVEDIERVVVRKRPESVSLTVADVATVTVAPMVRQGAVTRDGRGEAVTGMVMMLLGQNSRQVVHDAKVRLQEVERTLPPGVKLEVIYDRAHLIDRTLSTVLHNLVEGGALVIVILLVLLGSIRAGLIVAVAIPLSMLFASSVMAATGITASLMSLGAIDFGLIVDSSVIMIENCMRRLSHSDGTRSRADIIRDAAIEVRKPTMFGELIIAVVYLPILALYGTEGKLFRPMALTVLFALAGSLVLSLTLMPVLASLFLPKRVEERDVWLIRTLKRFYRPAVALAVARPVLTASTAVCLLLASIPVAMHLGGEFMPKLEEGDLLIEAVRLPSATLEDSIAMSTQIERLLLPLPEVKSVFCKTGRPEIANDVMGVHQTDVWVMLRPVTEWPQHKSHDELIEQMSWLLVTHIPGVKFGFSQPIEMRVNELVAGVKADVAVLLYGDDLEVLGHKGKQIEQVLAGIRGASDVKADYQANVPMLRIEVKPERLAVYGIDSAEVMNAVATVGGHEVGQILDGRARFPIIVRYPKEWRENSYLLEQVPVSEVGGQQVPLGVLADVILEDTPPGIDHESNAPPDVRIGQCAQSRCCEFRPRSACRDRRPRRSASRLYDSLGWYVRASPHGQPATVDDHADRAGDHLRTALQQFWVRKTGAADLSGGAGRRLGRSIRIGSAGDALQYFGWRWVYRSIRCGGAEWPGVGKRCRALRREGMAPHDAAKETAMGRLRPVLMTALVASFGFVPMAMSTTAGAEIQRPLASVVIGGLVTSTLLTAFVVPAIYPWFVNRSDASENA